MNSSDQKIGSIYPSALREFRAITATDLDGTLLCSKGECSARNRRALHGLAQASILRVVATGRSLYSVRKTLEGAFPMDLLVFSSGAGVWDWKTGEILHQVTMSNSEALRVAECLRGNGMSFMAHAPIPDNHRFWFFQTANAPIEFAKRCEMHGDFASPWDGTFPPQGVTQFIVMAVTSRANEEHSKLRKLLPEQSVVRATSPWNSELTWLEIFPKAVTKGYALDWIQTRFCLQGLPTFALGNDYNDVDLLDWAIHRRVVANAPVELLNRYESVVDNDSDGFYQAVRAWLSSISWSPDKAFSLE